MNNLLASDSSNASGYFSVEQYQLTPKASGENPSVTIDNPDAKLTLADLDWIQEKNPRIPETAKKPILSEVSTPPAVISIPKRQEIKPNSDRQFVFNETDLPDLHSSKTLDKTIHNNLDLTQTFSLEDKEAADNAEVTEQLNALRLDPEQLEIFTLESFCDLVKNSAWPFKIFVAVESTTKDNKTNDHFYSGEEAINWIRDPDQTDPQTRQPLNKLKYFVAFKDHETDFFGCYDKSKGVKGNPPSMELLRASMLQGNDFHSAISYVLAIALIYEKGSSHFFGDNRGMHIEASPIKAKAILESVKTVIEKYAETEVGSPYEVEDAWASEVENAEDILHFGLFNAKLMIKNINAQLTGKFDEATGRRNVMLALRDMRQSSMS